MGKEEEDDHSTHSVSTVGRIHHMGTEAKMISLRWFSHSFNGESRHAHYSMPVKPRIWKHSSGMWLCSSNPRSIKDRLMGVVGETPTEAWCNWADIYGDERTQFISMRIRSKYMRDMARQMFALFDGL